LLKPPGALAGDGIDSDSIGVSGLGSSMGALLILSL